MLTSGSISFALTLVNIACIIVVAMIMFYVRAHVVRARLARVSRRSPLCVSFLHSLQVKNLAPIGSKNFSFEEHFTDQKNNYNNLRADEWYERVMMVGLIACREQKGGNHFEP